MPKELQKDTDNLEFANRLIALVEAKGQPRHGAGAYLARKYNVTTVTANAWLNGEHKMEIPLAKRIAEDHGSNFNDFYFGSGDQLPDFAFRVANSTSEYSIESENESALDQLIAKMAAITDSQQKINSLKAIAGHLSPKEAMSLAKILLDRAEDGL